MSSTTPVDRATTLLGSDPGSDVQVVHRGRAIGSIERALVRRASSRGIEGLTLRDLLVDAPGPPASAADCRRIVAAVRERLDPLELRWLRKVGSHGTPTFLVGGIIRDLALGRESHDLDLAVEGDVTGLARELGGKPRIHPAFATATVELDNGPRLDLAATRRESYVGPASLPRVRPASIEQDLWRRDFALNALAIRLTRAGPGALLDPCRGMYDLRKRRLRVMHGLSFVDDPTRAFRAIRFAADFGFAIAARTESSIRAAARLELFARLSATRLRRELRLIFEGRRPGDALRRMTELGIWRAALPPVALQPEVHAHLDRVPRLVQRFPRRSSGEPVSRWIVSLGILLCRSSDDRVERFLERLQPGRREQSILRRTRSRLRKIESRLGDSRRLSPSEVHAACREVPTETLLTALALSSSLHVRRRVSRFLRCLRGISTSIDGSDLLRAGVPAGPAVARGLEAALRARLDGRAMTPTEQLRHALGDAGTA